MPISSYKEHCVGLQEVWGGGGGGGSRRVSKISVLSVSYRSLSGCSLDTALTQ